MDKVFNVALMKNPLNWAIVTVVCVLALAAVTIIRRIPNEASDAS